MTSPYQSNLIVHFSMSCKTVLILTVIMAAASMPISQISALSSDNSTLASSSSQNVTSISRSEHVVQSEISMERGWLSLSLSAFAINIDEHDCLFTELLCTMMKLLCTTFAIHHDV